MRIYLWGTFARRSYGDVSILSDWFPVAVVAKYLTSTSSSCCNFSKFGSICDDIISWPFAEGLPAAPDFSSCEIVPSVGRRLRVSMRTAYDFATLKRILGMASETRRSSMGRIDSLMISRVMTGARVCAELVTRYVTTRQSTHGYGKTCGHPVKIIRVLSHGHDFRNYCIISPIHAKDFGKFLQVLCCCFSD